MLQDKVVLIVDDDTTLSDMYGEMIKSKGALVTHALDGAEAIKKATNDLPNFVLLDLMLPKMNGFDVLKMLKGNEMTKNIPVMVFSALNEEDKRKKSLSLGAVDYVAKSEVLPRDLIEKIKKYIV